MYKLLNEIKSLLKMEPAQKAVFLVVCVIFVLMMSA